MSPTETYEAQIALMAVMNNLWEIWLGGTAAFIVAFHVGRKSVTLLLLSIGCCLYLAACVSLVMRYIAYIEMIASMSKMLVAAGHAPYPMPEWFGVPNTLLTLAIFLFGTMSALYFAVYQYRGRDA